MNIWAKKEDLLEVSWCVLGAKNDNKWCTYIDIKNAFKFKRLSLPDLILIV